MLRLRFSLWVPGFIGQRGALTASAQGPVDAFADQRTPSALVLHVLNRQIPQADQVVGSGRKGEDPSHLEDSTMPNFSQ